MLPKVTAGLAVVGCAVEPQQKLNEEEAEQCRRLEPAETSPFLSCRRDSSQPPHLMYYLMNIHIESVGSKKKKRRRKKRRRRKKTSLRLPLTDLLRPIDRKVPLNNFAKTWIDRRLEKMHDPFRERRLLVTHYHRRQTCLTYENVSLSRLGNKSPLQREKA